MKAILHLLLLGQVVPVIVALAFWTMNPLDANLARRRVFSASLAGAVLGAITITFLLGTPDQPSRYSHPFLYTALIPVGVAGFFSARTSWRGLGLALCLVMFVGNLWVDLYDTSSHFRRSLRGQAGLVASDRQQIRKAQASIPKGGRMLVSLKDAYLLDFSPNPIWHFNHPGMVSPPPGLPIPADPRAFDDFLMEKTTELPTHAPSGLLLSYFRHVGVDFLLFQRGLPGDRWWPRFRDHSKVDEPWSRQTIALGALIYKQIEEIKHQCQILYDDGDIVALDLRPRDRTASEPPRVVQQVKVYSEPGRFAGWPANRGIWSWGDEILVGFSRGYDKDNGADYHIDPDQPEDFLQARSKDGGATWSIEEPNPPGAMVGTRGMRHGAMPRGIAEERPSPLREPIDFTHPHLALAVHMEDHRTGASCFYFSYDRGKIWRGPFGLPLFGQHGVMGRTDYIVEGRRTCLLFLTATKSDGTEGRPFSARTTDGGLTWQFLAFIGPELRGYSVMPSTVRVSATDLVTTVRCREMPRRWIDAYVSHDDGRSWSFLATPAPDIGLGNPPCLARLADSRLCLTYGFRDVPFAIHARLSSDQGKSWTDPFVLRADGGSQDIGYPRSIVRSDGKVVTVYAFHDRTSSVRDIQATVWDPGIR